MANSSFKNEQDHTLFLSTANFATNPRLVKEVRTALSMEKRVTVILFLLENWSKNENLRLSEELRALGDLTILNLNAEKSSKLSWLLWGTSEKFFRKMYFLFKKSLAINALANTRRSYQLLIAGITIKQKPDLISAHNLGALYPAYLLSKKWKCPFVFDVEDYHPGEIIKSDSKNEIERRESLMKEFLPQAEALTSASPAIGEYTLNLIGGHKNHHVILNGFPQKEFQEPINQATEDSFSSQSLRLIWFSQKVGAGRGLEQLMEALLQVECDNRTIELTLIGELDNDFHKNFIKPFQRKKSNRIFLYQCPPMPQSELHRKMSEFDAGLALEFNSTDLNRQLCLTNKILAYAQAGLFIVATDTKAQVDFIAKHPNLGIISGQSTNDLKEIIDYLFKALHEIRKNSTKRYKESAALSWDQEAEKLKKLWNNIN